jgi:GrpB-like predicted nucleotidyltransferase (UPF0157 family)
MTPQWRFDLREYDPDWPAIFRAEQIALEKILGDLVVAYEHIGSTSIPGMSAVPTIDILAGVRRLQDADRAVEALVAAGWEHRPDVERRIPERRFFNKPPGPRHRTTRSHHLHIVEHGGPQWQSQVSFRDFLRQHPDTARAYLDLKKRLADQDYENPSDYSAQKAEFVAEVLRLARRP